MKSGSKSDEDVPFWYSPSTPCVILQEKVFGFPPTGTIIVCPQVSILVLAAFADTIALNSVVWSKQTLFPEILAFGLWLTVTIFEVSVIPQYEIPPSLYTLR